MTFANLLTIEMSRLEFYFETYTLYLTLSKALQAANRLIA